MEILAGPERSAYDQETEPVGFRLDYNCGGVVLMLQKSFVLGAVLGVMALGPMALASGSPSQPVSPKPMTQPMMHHKMMSAAQHRAWLMKVQKALNHSGAHLKADGMWGPKTMMAIRSFQKSHGLKATGHLNKATLTKLGVVWGAAKKKAWHKK